MYYISAVFIRLSRVLCVQFCGVGILVYRLRQFQFISLFQTLGRLRFCLRLVQNQTLFILTINSINFCTSKLDLRSKPSIPCNSSYLKIHSSDLEQIKVSQYWVSSDDINAFQYVLCDHRKISLWTRFQDIGKLSWEQRIASKVHATLVTVLVWATQISFASLKA